MRDLAPAIKRRTGVVGIVANEVPVVLKAPRAWAIAEGRYVAERSMARLHPVRDDELAKGMKGALKQADGAMTDAADRRHR